MNEMPSAAVRDLALNVVGVRFDLIDSSTEIDLSLLDSVKPIDDAFDLLIARMLTATSERYHDSENSDFHNRLRSVGRGHE